MCCKNEFWVLSGILSPLSLSLSLSLSPSLTHSRSIKAVLRKLVLYSLSWSEFSVDDDYSAAAVVSYHSGVFWNILKIIQAPQDGLHALTIVLHRPPHCTHKWGLILQLEMTSVSLKKPPQAKVNPKAQLTDRFGIKNSFTGDKV